MIEIVRWDLFEDLLRSYIMTNVISKFPEKLSLQLFFRHLIVFNINYEQDKLGNTKHNDKLYEYLKTNYQQNKLLYNGLSVYYDNWCNFCKEKGVQNLQQGKLQDIHQVI